jgi:hypothetical protein
MIVYKFRLDMVYDGPVELPDAPSIPKFHTFEAPPEKEGYYAVMRGGWQLVEGEKPAWPPVVNTVIDPEQQREDKIAAIRQERNKKLKNSDWTQVKDVPQYISDPWTIYRQTLRDITELEGFPDTFEWPEEPTVGVSTERIY